MRLLFLGLALIMSGGVGAGYLNFTPAPEPATILLLCAAAGGTFQGVRRWRSARRQRGRNRPSRINALPQTLLDRPSAPSSL